MSATRRLVFLVLIGLGGVGVLVSLGLWQVDRLYEKRALIAELERQLAGAPVEVTGAESGDVDNYRAARAEGRFDPAGPIVRFLTSVEGLGPGFRLIQAFELAGSGERILIDRGFAPEAAAPRGGAAPPPPRETVSLTGALHWPRETSAFTPEPNQTDLIWYARDVPSLAEALETRPVLMALSQAPAGAPGNWPKPVPVSVDLPDNHLSYAVTWFALAGVWTIMTLALALAGRGRKTEEGAP